jgi:hypothetical protein
MTTIKCTLLKLSIHVHAATVASWFAAPNIGIIVCELKVPARNFVQYDEFRMNLWFPRFSCAYNHKLVESPN